MRLSIFSRLVISYMLLFSMFVVVSLYFITHLNSFNRLLESIMIEDTAVMETSAKISDIFLDETRYDRKFVVFKDNKLHMSYQRAKENFSNQILKASAQASTPEIKISLEAIKTGHEQFSLLVDQERSLIESATPYDYQLYENEKKELSTGLINQLKEVRQASEKNVFSKINKLREESIKVGSVVIMITTITLITGLVIAAIITRSIIKPLNIMKAKTKEISKGNFTGDLNIVTPPAIHELAISINDMCHKLMEVDTIKSDFFSHMSHELRTPLTSIQEGTNLLMEGHGGEIPKSQEKILSIIAQESRRMILIVNSLLDLAKMEAGMFEYHYSETNMQALIQEAIFTLAPLAEAKAITIANNIGTLPIINVDQERMKQVFRNLVGNALKFTPKNKTVTLAAKVEDHHIQFSISDTGPGIPAAELERIFFKFRQVIPATGDKIKGTGLGLATVKQIIIAHGGKVWATSQIGSGSTFYISLPLS